MTTENNGNRGSRSRRKTIIPLVGLGLLGIIGFWGFKSFKDRSFHTLLYFDNARGITRGMPITYWGAPIGQVVGFEPEPKGVAVEVEIWPSNRVIPRDSLIKVLRGEGENAIEIQPRQALPPAAAGMSPRSPRCDRKLIFCHTRRMANRSRLSWGNLVYSLNSIQDINAEVANLDSNVGDVTSDVREMKTTVQSLGELGQDARGLLKSDKLDRTLGKLEATLNSVQLAADNMNLAAQKVGRLSDEATKVVESARQTKTIDHLNSTLVSVGGAADQVQGFMTINKSNLSSTLTSIEQLSKQMTITVRKLDPLSEQIQQSQLLKNLEIISSNTAQLTHNLNQITTQLNDPQSSLQLQHILDSARSLFENLNKITSDIDELTGNPRFRQDILRLIQGLSHLLSSVQQLQQQVAYQQMLNRVAHEMEPPATVKPLYPSPIPLTAQSKRDK